MWAAALAAVALAGALRHRNGPRRRRRPAAVEVVAPATSANLGPGYDALGAALDALLRVRVTVADPKRGVVVETRGEQGAPLDERNLVLVGLRAAFAVAGEPAPAGLLVQCESAIPTARGLGSSAAAIVCGVLAGMALSSGRQPCRDAALQLCADLEGHPDNVGPALLGGVRVGFRGRDGRWRAEALPCARPLRCALFVPDAEGTTAAARAVLPAAVPREDAVHNVGRTALLGAALATGSAPLLREAASDRLHEPQRAALYPHFAPAVAAALEAGATAAWLSGAGPTVLAVVWSSSGAATDIGAAMAAAAGSASVPGRVMVAGGRERGAEVRFVW